MNRDSQIYFVRLRVAREIAEAVNRYMKGREIEYDEIAGILLTHESAILSALTEPGVRCERCECTVTPVWTDGDPLCPHCGLVL